MKKNMKTSSYSNEEEIRKKGHNKLKFNKENLFLGKFIPWKIYSTFTAKLFLFLLSGSICKAVAFLLSFHCAAWK